MNSMKTFQPYKTPSAGMRRDQAKIHPSARAQQIASGETGTAFRHREVQMGERPHRPQQE